MMVLLIDGYNLIHAHPRLSQIISGDRDAAIDGLLKELLPLNYPDYYELLIVVFDAAASRHPQPVVEDRQGISVVFTRRKQSADSFIETTVRHLVSENDVQVATNDRQLAAIASGFGAHVIGVESVLGMARQALGETRRKLRSASRDRSPLEDRVSEEIRRLLDEMRYQ